MPEHTPHTGETDLLRMQIEASTWEVNELTRTVDLLENLVEFHREESAQLRVRLRRAEESLAQPVVEGVEDLEEVAA